MFVAAGPYGIAMQPRFERRGSSRSRRKVGRVVKRSSPGPRCGASAKHSPSRVVGLDLFGQSATTAAPSPCHQHDQRPSTPSTESSLRTSRSHPVGIPAKMVLPVPGVVVRARHWHMSIVVPPTDRQSIHVELERARTDMHHLVGRATSTDLRRGTSGTRWNNAQLLWHMAFGYLLVRRLLPLVRLFGRLPDPLGRTFAAGLNSGTRAFHHINYLGSVGGALVYRGPRLTRQLDHTINQLHRRLDNESEAALRRRMHFPVDWDPFFHDTMTLEQVYRYGTQHYDFHRTQLTLE
jgi:hypothetical protein